MDSKRKSSNDNMNLTSTNTNFNEYSANINFPVLTEIHDGYLLEPFANNSGRQGTDVETEELNFSSTQMALKDEIEEGEYCIHEEYIETKMPPVPTKMTQLRFSTPTTMILLREYCKRIDKFRDKTVRRNLIWAEIVNEFCKMNYYTTVGQLSEKFRNLKKFYLVVKDNGTITWRYFKIFSQIMKAEAENLPLENFTDDQELTIKRSRLPILKFTKIYNKFKKTKPLKRKRGRPRKKKRSIKNDQGVKNFENNKDNSYSVEIDIPITNSVQERVSSYPVINEIPLLVSVQQKILSTDTQNINALETDKDNELCIAPRIVSPSPLNQEIPTGIPNMNEEVSEFQKRVLHIEEEKRDELRNLRLAVEENNKIQKKTIKLLERICERFLNSE